MRVTVEEKEIKRANYRYAGFVRVRDEEGRTYRLPMPGTVAQWLEVGEQVELTLERPHAITFDNYRLSREGLLLWPPFRREYVHERKAPLSGEVLYTYHLLAREARYERDYEAIVELEQYHYASDEEVLAEWYCEQCDVYQEANVRPTCPRCGRPMRFHDLKSATRASRFLVFELLSGAAYEPRYVAYVRVDPPIPLMNRRLPDGRIQKNIRQAVFPPEWFAHPFHPKGKEGRSWWEVQEEALREVRSPVSRLARVVVHPDYRVDGLGQRAVLTLFDWMRERWVPEMRVEKEAVETIAMMARYNPFMEKVGFIYLWDTGSGRPVLYYPLSERAREYIERFLAEDPVAREHGGRLYRPRFDARPSLPGPIRLEDVQKGYTNRLTVEDLSEPVRRLLEAFGVRYRVIQKYVIRRATATFAPGTVNVIIGGSGSGKTTLLRVLYGALTGKEDPLYQVDGGKIEVPEGARAQALLPGELEPDFGEAPIAEVLYRITGDEALAVEILNYAGISDAVLYRAPYRELSTGQKERARLAYVLAHRPNVVLIDEFVAHLDTPTALRVARRLASLAREQGITLFLVLHRQEILPALEPDGVYVVGYGTFFPLEEWPERGLKVREPYATLIVEGKKRWEIRKHPTRVRGRVGIISRGKVIGSVEITGVRGPFTPEELAEHQDKHQAPPEVLRAYAQGRPLYAWELANARAYPEPLPYRGTGGQQMWVKLRPPDASEAQEKGEEGQQG